MAPSEAAISTMHKAMKAAPRRIINVLKDPRLR
jgi:hypothetical protein